MLLDLILIILALGFAVGLLGNITGIGGGVMIILLLVYGFGFAPLEASGLSLLTLTFSSLIGLVQNTRKSLVDLKLFSVMAAFAVTGSIGGSIIANYIPSGTFKGIFGFFIIFLGLFSISASRAQTGKNSRDHASRPVYRPETGVVSVLAGIVSGFIGIGIGGIMGTYLTAFKRAGPRKAIATIIAATLPVTITGTTMHFYFTGSINLTFAPALVIGALLGGMVGSRIISRAPQVSLRFLQGYIIVAFGTLSVILYFLTVYFH